jgi:hypothetical protein
MGNALELCLVAMPAVGVYDTGRIHGLPESESSAVKAYRVQMISS